MRLFTVIALLIVGATLVLRKFVRTTTDGEDDG
jgi:hypothetical protein